MGLGFRLVERSSRRTGEGFGATQNEDNGATIRGYYHWELLCDNNKIMMQVINGVPSLPQDAIGEPKFREHVRRIFTQSPLNEDALWNIVVAAVKQKH
jgi:hypothetical protein